MSASVQSLPKEQRKELEILLKEQDRRKYLGDLFLFNRDLLAYDDMAVEPHLKMCQSASNPDFNRKLHLWPRGHFKSSMITVGYTVQKICYNPNIRIFIGNQVLGNAKSFLREIKGHFERNDTLRDLYGDHVSDARTDAGKWSETQIISKKRKLNLKEPTIQVAGVGQSLASQHYDVMILDDLLDQDSVTTQEQIEKTKDWYRLAISLLEPDGELIIIGTRYHDSDLYGWLIENFSDRFDIQVHSAYVDDDEDQGSIFPTRFTKEVLDEIRKDQGSYIFSCQYRNNPVDEATAKFKKSNFRYYEQSELDGMTLYTTMCVDRAYSLRRTADSTGITIRSKDITGRWYMRYAKRHKQEEGDLIKSIFDLRSYFRVDKVGIEQKAFEYTIKPTLEDEMRARQDFFTVVELKDSQAKLARIEGLIPVVESHSLFLIKDEMTDLEDELTRFPSAKHDDLADSTAYHQSDEMDNQPSAEIRKKVPVYDKRTGRVIGYR